jgi:hypothetical protein
VEGPRRFVLGAEFETAEGIEGKSRWNHPLLDRSPVTDAAFKDDGEVLDHFVWHLQRQKLSTHKS